MYRRTNQKQVQEEEHRGSFSRSRSQYLKQNWNPNVYQSQLNLLNNSQSISNIRKNERRRSSLTQEEEIKSTKKKTSSKNIGLKHNRARGSITNIIEEVVPHVALGRPREPLQEDFIKPQDIGMNSKAVHHQLQSAMQRQIERQKAEIVALNSTIMQLKQKDKAQVSEISRLTNLIGQLEFQLMEDGSRKKPQSTRQPTDDLQSENKRLRHDLQETQQLIKKVLLDREKQRMFTFHN